MKNFIFVAILSCVAGCGSDDSGSAANAGAAGASSCSPARAQLLGAVDSVSTSDVSLVDDTDGIALLYVDATAGGAAAAAMNPWIFVSLGDSSKAEVTDLSSAESTAWDLALKRTLLYTNGGDGGPGEGGAVFIEKDFQEVTAEDATAVTFAREQFVDEDCKPVVDPAGAASTSFSAWYDYDGESHVLTPRPGTWLVHGASGKLFKLHIKSYYGTPEGGAGAVGGAYLLEVGAL